MVKSFKISNSIKSEMIMYYKNYEITPPQYASHAFKLNEYKIVIYNSLKVVFTGNYNDCDIDLWMDKTGYFQTNIVGSDEVGTGDFFGPIIVVSAYVNANNVDQLKKLQIVDSKNLSDENIVDIASKLVKIVEYKVVCCDNIMYNDLYAKGYNIKQILAFLHQKAILLLNKNCLTVVDQFVEKKVFEKYINENVDYMFMTKAESEYAAVAIASIIARAFFIKKMNELEIDINSQTKRSYKIIYGAGEQCDNVARNILGEIGINKFKDYVKMNFKNIDKIK